ncbi:MAG: hypothetical protein Q9219_007660 [cf. Caloplaca sp. 3 TL-2023]
MGLLNFFLQAPATAISEDSDQEGNASSLNGYVEDADDPKEEWMLDTTGQSPRLFQLLLHPYLAQALLEKFFGGVHPIGLSLLEQDSRLLFIDTWASDEPPKPIHMVQLSLIMYLGCRQSDSEANGTQKLLSNDATTCAKDLYQRTRGYVYAHVFTAASIGMLQALLLMASC